MDDYLIIGFFCHNNRLYRKDIFMTQFSSSLTMREDLNWEGWSNLVFLRGILSKH